jgi:hypothetical protein
MTTHVHLLIGRDEPVFFHVPSHDLERAALRIGATIVGGLSGALAHFGKDSDGE